LSSSTASELSSLPGLESAKRVVVGLASGSAVQSVLFYGMEGSGKKRLAQILTKAWLCTRNQGAGGRGQAGGISVSFPGGACGECQACLAFERGRSVDLLWLEPKGASRIIRLAAISPAEEDDDYPVSAQLFLRTPPLAARNKIVVIEGAERLNPRAANSLLKTLEEPPPFGRFILLTDTVGSILPTILSRCLAVACEVPRDAEGLEPWALELASGAPGRAREILEHAAAYRPLYEFGLTLVQRRKGEALIAAEEFAGLAERLQGARKIGARSANAEALQVLAVSYGLNPDKRAAALQAIIEAHRRVLGNANAGSVLDAMFASALG
jgi:DNA polymerase-3 subunit delta'